MLTYVGILIALFLGMGIVLWLYPPSPDDFDEPDTPRKPDIDRSEVERSLQEWRRVAGGR